MATVLRSQCAFLRLFIGKSNQILNNAIDSGTKLIPGSLSVIISLYFHVDYVEKLICLRHVTERWVYTPARKFLDKNGFYFCTLFWFSYILGASN